MSNENNIPLPHVEQHAAVGTVIEKEVIEEVIEVVSVAQLTALVLVNFDLTSRDTFLGSNGLSEIAFDSGEYNVYSPFISSKDKEGSTPGVARKAVLKAVETMEGINKINSILGSEEQIANNLKAVLQKVISDVEGALPAKQLDQIAELSGVEDDAAVILTMQDVVKVTGHLNAGTPDNNTPFVPYSMVLTITVNAGEMYDTQDPHKYLNKVNVFLKKVGERFPETPIISAFTVSGEDLVEEVIQNLITMCVGEHTKTNYVPFGRYQLTSIADTDWAPQERSIVEKHLLCTKGDLFFIKVLGD